MEATTKWLDRLRQAKPGNLRIVFLAVSLFPAPLALSLDTVPSYTPEQLRAALKRSYQAAAKESISSVINVQALKEFTSAKHCLLRCRDGATTWNCSRR